jgi:predicted nucleic acid-binding protein
VGAPLKAVLDTSVVIASDIDPVEGELAINAVTLAELHFGVLVAKQPKVRAERLRRLRTFDALPLDEPAAASYGQIAAPIFQAGRQPRAGATDLLIAATAHAHGARLYTRKCRRLSRSRRCTRGHRDRSARPHRPIYEPGLG